MEETNTEESCVAPPAVGRSTRTQGAVEDCQAILGFVNRCQVLVGSLPFLQLVEDIQMVSRLRTCLPTPRTAVARSVLASLVTEIVLRIRRMWSVQPPIATIALAHVMAARTSAEFSRVPELLRVLESELAQILISEQATGLANASAVPAVCRAGEVLRRCFDRADFRLSSLAREVGLSESRCEHILRECTGFTFREHLDRLRVNRAKRLLRRQDLSVKEIAAAVGYASASSFDRGFKRAVGISPCVWRRYHLQEARIDNQ